MPQETFGGRSRWAAQPFLHSLKTKFVAALILLVGVVLGLSTWWNLSLHTRHMIQASEEKVQALAEAIDGGIQVAMREQTAKKLLPKLLPNRDFGFKQRLEAFIHLTGYMVHPLMFSSFVLACLATFLRMDILRLATLLPC